jgi:NAD(P)-dependent dehydrogenase (short-subunit alcohol dehydrogenase family)
MTQGNQAMNRYNLENRVVIVTGGTSGIGDGSVRFLAECGAKVVSASIQEELGVAQAESFAVDGLECLFQLTDLRNELQVKSLIDMTLERFGRIDGVFSSAGMIRTGKITDLTLDDFRLVLDVNLLGPAWLAKYTVSVMERQKSGVMVFATSVAADIGFPEHSIYGASKAGLVAMIRSLTTDHSPAGLRFYGISPGTIETPMLAASCEGFDKPQEELYAEVAQKVPVRRLGKPIDVARVAAFLLTEDASFMNGCIVPVEGGTLCLPPW